MNLLAFESCSTQWCDEVSALPEVSAWFQSDVTHSNQLGNGISALLVQVCMVMLSMEKSEGEERLEVRETLNHLKRVRMKEKAIQCRINF